MTGPGEETGQEVLRETQGTLCEKGARGREDEPPPLQPSWCESSTSPMGTARGAGQRPRGGQGPVGIVLLRGPA